LPRWKTLVFVFALCCASLWIFTPSWIAAVTLSATVGIIGISIVVITGYAGQLSLAQFAFAGIAALVSSRLAATQHTTFLLAALCGVAVALGVGLVVALPAVRVRGVNLAVVTMAFAVVINSAVLSNTNWIGGAVTGTVVPNPTIFGVDVQSVHNPRLWCITCLVALLVAALVASNLRRGRSGRRLIAVRDNERAAASVGIDVVTAKLYAFAIAAALAGLGGVLLAFQNSTVDFLQFAPFASIQIVLLVVIGSIGYVLGGILGGVAVVAGVAQEIVGDEWAVGDWFQFFLALLFLVAIVAHSDGFVAFIAESMAPKARRLIGSLRHRDPKEVACEERTVEIRPAVSKTIEVRDLEVQFGGLKAVEGLSFKVNPGEVFGLIGPNGAGKTTVVDALSGFLPHYGGQVLLGGVSIDNLRAARRAKAGVTRSFQSLELFEDLSVAENLGVAADDDRRRFLFLDLVFPRRQELTPAAAAVVQEFDLGGVLEKRPGELPYAQRRTVAIARAVAAAPSVLLLDEPAAGLDIGARRELEILIRRLADEWNMAVLLIEHDVAMVMRTCDRVMALEFGRELATGTPDEIGRNQAVIDSYLGVNHHQTLADPAPETSSV
jgi:ABC-type branched-subunit amino acid transport system ATPase component/ABC-type branched-subunit amino acid transport system permease subunit